MNQKLDPLHMNADNDAIVEVFYGDRMFSSMRDAGWFWWSYKPGEVPVWPPNGPHTTRSDAYRDAFARQGGNVVR